MVDSLQTQGQIFSLNRYFHDNSYWMSHPYLGVPACVCVWEGGSVCVYINCSNDSSVLHPLVRSCILSCNIHVYFVLYYVNYSFPSKGFYQKHMSILVISIRSNKCNIKSSMIDRCCLLAIHSTWWKWLESIQ